MKNIIKKAKANVSDAALAVLVLGVITTNGIGEKVAQSMAEHSKKEK